MAQLVKKSACNMGLIPGWGRSPGEGSGYALQYSGLENSMGCLVRAVAKSRTQLSDFPFHSIFIWLHQVSVAAACGVFNCGSWDLVP